MKIFLDEENLRIVMINSTKDSEKLFDMKKDNLKFKLIFHFHSGGTNQDRRYFDINYELFGITNKEHKNIMTATEYLKTYNN